MAKMAFEEPTGLVDEAPHADVHDDAEGEEGEEDRGAAVAEQGQGDSCDGHEADDHADVDCDLEDDDGDDAHDDEAAREGRGGLCGLYEAAGDEEVEVQ